MIILEMRLLEQVERLKKLQSQRRGGQIDLLLSPNQETDDLLNAYYLA